MDDLSLARALLSRDSRAPREAWIRFNPVVRAIVIHRLGSDAEVDDLTQEVFYRLFANVGTLRKPQALRHFVVSFAIRMVKWERRKRRIRRRVRLTTTGAIPDRPVETSPRYDFWDACRLCDELVPRQREVMLLRHVEGMTLPEISETLGLSLATIKRSLRAARLRVSKLLACP